MVVTEDEINDYLLKVKEAIKKDKYKLERNRNRVDNNNLFNLLTSFVKKISYML